MLEQVDLKIEELKKLRAEEYYKKKEEDLQAWGLTSKKNGKKVTPIIVTDEEYDALIKAANGVGKTGRNSVVNTLKFAEIAVLVAGVLGGTAAWSASESLGFVWFTFFIVAGILVALLFKGIAEAIRLLQQIIDSNPVEKPDPAYAKTTQKNYKQPNVVVQPQVTPVVPIQVPTYIQPPIYQAAATPVAVAQPYYAPQGFVVQESVNKAEKEAVKETDKEDTLEIPSYGAPQDYNEMNSFGADIEDDFFSKAPVPEFGFDYEKGLENN